VAPADTLRPLLALGVIGGLLLVARRWRPPGLLAGSAAALSGLQITEWIGLMVRHPLAPQPLLAHLLPLAGLALLLIWAARATPFRLLGLDLLGLHLGLGSYLLLDPIAPQLPGVAWLMLALIALEAANQLPRAEALHTLAQAIGFLVAFAGSYLLVSIQSPATLAVGAFQVRGRLLIELFAIAVALYFWAFRPGPRLAQLRLWQGAQPCFLEAALVGVGLTILMESPVLWRPMAWSALALALVCPPLNRVLPIRMQLYSVLVYWVGVATVVAMLSTLESPSPHWWEQPRPIALGAMALQVGYILASMRWLNLERLRQPGGLPILAWVGTRIANRRNGWLYYPMFAAVAVYLAIRYDRSLLTLLWAAEAFGLYVLSAVLRENHFRYVALLGLGACLVRLLAIDMAQADLGLRGLVFIGVGLLLLAMNAIYNRFRSRFE
ncbi:MAG: hypothetical protein ACKOPT_17680, partial [Cyanobium sp.]